MELVNWDLMNLIKREINYLFTGDIAFRYLYYLKNMRNSEILNKVTVCDINPDMLEVGKKRAASLAHEESINLNRNILKKI